MAKLYPSPETEEWWWFRYPKSGWQVACVQNNGQRGLRVCITMAPKPLPIEALAKQNVEWGGRIEPPKAQ